MRLAIFSGHSDTDVQPAVYESAVSMIASEEGIKVQRALQQLEKVMPRTSNWQLRARRTRRQTTRKPVRTIKLTLSATIRALEERRKQSSLVKILLGDDSEHKLALRVRHEGPVARRRRRAFS